MKLWLIFVLLICKNFCHWVGVSPKISYKAGFLWLWQSPVTSYVVTQEWLLEGFHMIVDMFHTQLIITTSILYKTAAKKPYPSN